MAEGNRRERRGERRGRGRPERRDFSKDRDRRDPETAAFRVRSELGALEKAYSQKDFAKQKASLEEILKALKPLRLRSIDELDFNTRGRLITTLLRVGRQPPPPAPPAPAPAPEPAAPTAVEEATSAPAPVEGAPAQEVPDQPPEGPVEASPPAEKPAAAPVAEIATGFAEMMFTLGSIWRAVADPRRAEVAFAASGRQPESEPATPPPTTQQASDWREQAKQFEEQGRTRDAARLHERQQSFAEAARLFETGRDLKSAARCALAAKDWETGRRILKALPVDEGRNLLEKAGAYELLMERYVEASDFQSVARLYERAKQFDQAALAWERAGKLGNARKAYQRAKDEAGSQRIRALEVEQLVQRGDRLGAAVLLLGENRREEATQVLLALPASKAFHFLQKVKLDEEALALARREIEQANAENKPSVKARWLEWTGDALAAAEAWEAAERKDKALEMYEQVGQWQKAAQIAEALGRREKALELYHRAGDRDSAARLELSPPQATQGPPSPAVE